ncbi:hypothetical protein [Bradyrhizobium sp. DASA03007]|uniref:DUF7831 domain-containing protein n=1 Tax=unclassified Bradyrhizobium TaxID=2631580 RepID=UPI003F72C891
MPIRYQKFIRRQDLRNNRDKFYVFGDNVLRIGYGGQAREMRGESNAIGVVTKWAPSNNTTDFFDDDPSCWARVTEDLTKVARLLAQGETVIVPEDGIGTGLAQLPRRAPKLDAFIKAWFKERS